MRKGVKEREGDHLCHFPLQESHTEGLGCMTVCQQTYISQGFFLLFCLFLKWGGDGGGVVFKAGYNLKVKKILLQNIGNGFKVSAVHKLFLITSVCVNCKEHKE